MEQRQERLNQLTSTELGQHPRDNKVYEGLGKASVVATFWCPRVSAEIVISFVASTISSVDERLAKESRTLKSEISALEKRLHYLEMTHRNSCEHMEKILQTGGRS